jgi:hypothetical protein
MRCPTIQALNRSLLLIQIPLRIRRTILHANSNPAVPYYTSHRNSLLPPRLRTCKNALPSSAALHLKYLLKRWLGSVYKDVTGEL